MFSLLDLLNSYLAYFTTNTRTKGRIYTTVCGIGVWYLLYLAIQYLKNERYFRGWLLVAVFLLLLYFTVLNFFYYFTEKTVRWDFSRYTAKYLGSGAPADNPKERAVIVPANGLYDRKDVVKAEISINEIQRENINNLVHQLRALGMVTTNYGKLTEAAQRQVIAEKGVIHANHPGTLFPYFGMQEAKDGQIEVLAGINQLQALDVATIIRVGLMPVQAAEKEYRLALASVVLTGGKSRVEGRNGLMAVTKPHYVKVEVAYQKRDQSKQNDKHE
ncbi:DUF6681 family protein [Eupransor demetentiae]|uniref:Uncharacterized protein n=1 Tax=Eupransor demetentiae TaxID=3109584 RepID=A0ABM9N6P8_9LACO|nr:hypothetical protein R54876_GBNLAHCA_01483 [Lactobacillaceae bacterium LMG 33000]